MSKSQALSSVKVASVDGWKEAVSDEGRFRILFPREPAISQGGAQATGMRGYKLVEGETNWFALYNDFNNQRLNTESQIREAYHGSVEAITRKKGTQLLRQTDVVLNGKLGTEFVIEGNGAVSYMRAFLVGKRMYTLAVDRRRVVNGDSTVPVEVQQFFDSFTFWD